MQTTSNKLKALRLNKEVLLRLQEQQLKQAIGGNANMFRGHSSQCPTAETCTAFNTCPRPTNCTETVTCY